jgi:hypothetical protein
VRVDDEFGKRAGAGCESIPERYGTVVLEAFCGVAPVWQDDGGQLGRGNRQAGVRTDGCFPPSAVGVKGHANTTFGEVYRTGQRGNLLAGKRGSAKRQADVPARGGDADGERIGVSLHDHGLGTRVQESLAFGKSGQNVPLDIEVGVR